MYNPQIETFIKVADAGSFNKAAEEFYITPTAVIKQINLLERRELIRYCKDSVVRAKNAMSEGENIIRIGSSPITPAQLLMRLWPKIQDKCPDIKFEIIPFEIHLKTQRKFSAISVKILMLLAEYSTMRCCTWENARAWSCHASRFAVPYPVYYRHICKAGEKKFAQFAANVWGISKDEQTDE